MSKWILGMVLFSIVMGISFWRVFVRSPNTVVSPVGQWFEKPLEKYSIESLGDRIFEPSKIVFDEAQATTSAYIVYTFHYISDTKKVTGLAHIPKGNGPFPVIVQFRGYVDREQYTPGEGTRRSAQVFAQNGFISLAPDFLGYGGSDMPSEHIFEERFQTYTAALQLLASVGSLPMADASLIGIWGHSNGGQIALTVLEATQKSYPTTLWAPVTKPFPYSILYYTDEAADRGKFLRKKLAEFEENYDVDKYSITNYPQRIEAPLQLHQGSSDDAVPIAWSGEFVANLKDRGKTVSYFIYPGTDHNMMPNWNTVVSRDIEFFRLRLGEGK